MRFQTTLVPGRLLRRYKRFLADVTLEDGREVVAHCANPGAMTGLNEAGMRVWLEPNDDPKKKLRFGWRLLELPNDHWAGIDTSVPNRVVREALDNKKIAALADYPNIRPEVKYGQSSRIDFLLTGTGLPDAYLEVKNVHLSRKVGLAEFPDSKTLRGAKHLRELADMRAQGHRAIMLYLVQRTDCTRFRLADDVDPAYAAAFDLATNAGVEVLCYDTEISTAGVEFGRQVEVLR
ncbi:MAG: DNA/RNA nuclease SfsA [Marinosulfonomonas sp.]|nr:DNA/RNA nuclease SfsA [Marinosulfonomonas sp.]